MQLFRKLIFLFVLALISGSVFAKEYYRYRDTQGNYIVNDKVTKEMTLIGYDVLNDNGKVVKKVLPAKTLAEEEKERLKKIEAKKNEIELRKKIRNDAELLRQFSSIGDIIRNRDGQLLGLEQRIKIQKSKSALLTLQLEDQQKQAAIHERLGQVIPKLLQKDIQATRSQIKANENNSNTLEQEKIRIASRFEKDIVRYKALDSIRGKRDKNRVSNDGSRPITYDCPNRKVCQRAWQLAQIYAKDNASGQIEIITDTLILTSKPDEDSDLALSFSKIPGANDSQQIVLEVSCNDSVDGAELCRSELVKKTRKNYLELLKKRLD